MQKIKIVFVVSILISFLLGFYAGQEYFRYEFKKQIDKIGFQTNTSGNSNTVIDEQKKINDELSKMKTIVKNVGDELELATIKLKINSSKEENMIPVSYGQPIVAGEGTKFVIVEATVTNITKASFYFSSTDLVLTDDKGTQYKTFDKSYEIDNYINGDISPNIPKEGGMVFQLPNTVTSYSFMIIKSGSNDLYKVKLK